MIRFHFLTGDVNWLDYGGKWIADRPIESDWPVWLVISLINMHDATGDEDQDRYCVTLSAVAPDAVSEEAKASARSAYGYDDYMLPDPVTNELWVEMLDGCGYSAPLWQDCGNNAHKLLKEAREQAQISGVLFGFQMDRQVNGLGATGWDTIRGEIFPGKDGFTV